MRHKLLLAAAIVLSASSISAQAGCMRCGPIQNVTDSPVNSASGKPVSAEEVKKAIMRAGGTLGWKIAENGPGKMTGTLNVRSHTAVVDIPYSAKSYSINYKSSVNLNEEGGQIHNNYNGWVKNLDKGIQAQLAAP